MSARPESDIVILGGARDYHVMDWYRAIKKALPNRKVLILTDLIQSEGYSRIVNQDDHIEKLFIIDKFLFKKQSRIGNLWRNVFKLFVLPIQIMYLKNYVHKHPNSIFHAQPMYYMFLCWLANIKFVGTPQGDEILIRPHESKLYRYFAIKSLNAADYISVDSINMQSEIKIMSGVNAFIIRKGIDIKSLLQLKTANRTRVISIRGMTSLYRIKEILQARGENNQNVEVDFIYPFMEEAYFSEVSCLLTNKDKIIGRLNKEDMYKLLSEAFLTISIPKSDSSPRSVYEAIFAGSCVALTYNEYIDVLPACMQERLYIVDLNNKKWFQEAVEFSKIKAQVRYIPSQEALKMFDQDNALNDAIKKLY